MIDPAEIRRSMEAAWLLFLNRADAMRRFDVSVEGCWRSFQAILLIIPIYALTVIVEERRLLTDAVAEPDFFGSWFVIGRGVALAVDWVAFPILLALAAPVLGVARSYPAYVVARNWAAVLASLPFGAVALLTIVGLLSNEVGAVLSLIAIGVVLRYNFVVARRALGVGIGLAIALVAADFVLSLLIAEGVDGLFGVAASAQ
ncbi:MAG: hypothetical protein ABI399_11025 [Bauldia sp.]